MENIDNTIYKGNIYLVKNYIKGNIYIKKLNDIYRGITDILDEIGFANRDYKKMFNILKPYLNILPNAIKIFKNLEPIKRTARYFYSLLKNWYKWNYHLRVLDPSEIEKYIDKQKEFLEKFNINFLKEDYDKELHNETLRKILLTLKKGETIINIERCYLNRYKESFRLAELKRIEEHEKRMKEERVLNEKKLAEIKKLEELEKNIPTIKIPLMEKKEKIINTDHRVAFKRLGDLLSFINITKKM